jgi:hypothetical protein
MNLDRIIEAQTMNDITGDKQFVLKLLKDTARNLAVRHPEVKAAGMKKAIRPINEVQQVERDQIVERLQKAYEAAQFEPVVPAPATVKKGLKKTKGIKMKALAAPTATVVEDVWYAPRDRTIALFQSAMDEYLERKKARPKGATRVREKKVTKREARNIFYTRKPRTKGTAAAKLWVGEQYDNLDPGWLEVAFEKAKIFLKGKHPFIRHAKLSDFHYRIVDKEGSIRIVLIADWGGGNDHAQAVAGQIRNLDPAPDYVIHLGDVYYAGTDDEVNRRFFSFWPGSLEQGRSFALNSNHEMYSGGYAYFDITLPRLGQEASYFCLENDEWRLIGLDTGYIDHDLNVEQVEWLTALLNESDKKNILLSHHQLFSAYESGGGGEERLQRWTNDLAGKITAWYWGHEHLCVVYKPYKGIKGRCIGHGCFPYEIPPATPPFSGPQVEWVLRASDLKHSGRGLHGFALLEINTERLKVSHIDEAGTLQYDEAF